MCSFYMRGLFDSHLGVVDQAPYIATQQQLYRNIKNPVLDKDANPNAPAFQPFVAGRAVSTLVQKLQGLLLG